MSSFRGFPDGSAGKEPACNAGNAADMGSIPGLGWRRKKWQPTPVFPPEKPHGQRSLAGYSPKGRKVSDTTERLNTQNRPHQQHKQVIYVK